MDKPVIKEAFHCRAFFPMGTKKRRRIKLNSCSRKNEKPKVKVHNISGLFKISRIGEYKKMGLKD